MDSQIDARTPTPVPYTVELIKEKDSKKVLDMLKKFFFKVSKDNKFSYFNIIVENTNMPFALCERFFFFPFPNKPFVAFKIRETFAKRIF